MYDDIAGKVLHLDHIEDPNIRPLDELFRDHFLQCVLLHMKGAVEPTWDYEGALGGAHLEFEMAHRLHGPKTAQEYSR